MIDITSASSRLKTLLLLNCVSSAPDDIMRSEAMLPRLKITRCLSVIIPYVEDPSQVDQRF